MEIKNKLTVTRGGGCRDNRGKKGKGQGTCIKDLWTKTIGRVGLNLGGGVGRVR